MTTVENNDKQIPPKEPSGSAVFDAVRQNMEKAWRYFDRQSALLLADEKHANVWLGCLFFFFCDLGC